MTTTTTILVAIILILVGMLFFAVRDSRAEWLARCDAKDELIMARHTIAALAPKAKAWDDWYARQPAPTWPPLDIMETPLPGGQVAADLDKSYHVAYQHLSAECDGCDEPAKPVPQRRNMDRIRSSASQKNDG